MKLRHFPRFTWPISEIGYGMWGMGAWSGGDDREAALALDRAIDLGCTFFDTALAYGDGHSERLLGAALRRHDRQGLIVATKVPPRNGQWPGRPDSPADDVFPYEWVIDSTRRSLHNLGDRPIDLQQFHVWDDSWTAADGWRRAAEELKQSGLVRAIGISANRWEPDSLLEALETGLIDCVQVVYNIFDQAPEDLLFGECRRLDVGIIARVPFDEGSLTGTLRPQSQWPDGDWRNTYFAPPHLAETLRRVERLEALAAQWQLSLSDLALRFVLANPAVTTVIPGMRRIRHVERNLGCSDDPPLTDEQVALLRESRWDRRPDGRT